MIVRALSSLWTSCGPAMADHLWQSTVVVALATVLTFALRKNSARVRHRVWLAASMKFLLPFSLLIALGGHFAKPRVNTSAQAVVYSAVEQVSQPFAGYEDQVVYQAAPSQPSVGRFHWVAPMAVAVWLCGIAVVLLRWARAWVRVSRIVRNAVPLGEGSEVRALRKLELQFGMRKPIRFVMSQDWMEPGVFGIFRPVLMWPEGISKHLSESHLRAIVAHELCHVRRRDNLAAVLHMMVQAIFWFHPLVWWMEGNLEEERERACDEEVTLLFGEPEVYAESILKVCKFCSESPLACVSGITGADLKKRIMQIMKGRVTSRLGLGRRVLLLAVGLSIVTVPILMGQAKAAQRMMLAAVKAVPMPLRPATHDVIAEEHSLKAEETGQDASSAQDAAAQAAIAAAATGPAFEVASIRPANRNDGRHWFGTRVEESGRFTASAAPLSQLVWIAYIHGYGKGQVTGGPPWIESDSFDINAKVDDAYMAGWDKLSSAERMDRVRPMVRRLLAERFHLKLRVETQTTPVYTLIQAKGGTRMKEVPAPAPVEGDPIEALNRQMRDNPGKPIPGRILCTGNTCTGNGVPMSNAIGQIAASSHSDRMVIDQTGLKGYYDFTMTQPRHDDDSAMAEVEDDLGLKFEPRKMPMPTYIIESAEKPSLDGAGVDSNPQTSSTQGSQAPKPTAVQQFEVSTVKPSGADSGNSSGVGTHYGRIDAKNVTLKRCIIGAYEIGPHQVVGGPDWIDSQRFDIQARADQPINDDAVLDRMLQGLLADRFKLAMHREIKTMDTYVLEVDKRGPTMEKAVGGDSVTNNGSSGGGHKSLDAKNTSMDMLARLLARNLDLPVVNQTGIQGIYNFKLHWIENSTVVDQSGADDVSIFTATKEQLGLRLRKTKAQVEVFVVDRAEQPSAN